MHYRSQDIYGQFMTKFAKLYSAIRLKFKTEQQTQFS